MKTDFFRLPIIVLCTALTVGACGILGSSTTEVRLTNGSNVSFDQVSYFTENGLQQYVDLGPGESSPYLTVTLAYGIVTAEVIVAADTARLQVIDHVGDSPLDGGRYSYVLDLNGVPGDFQLEQSLRREVR